MGNRAVIAIDEFSPKAIGYYLHWNGGRDSIEGFLEATKRVMGDRLGDKTYGAARLAQVIGTFMVGNLSFGIGLQSQLDCDNYDNGVYVVDTSTMEIVGREYFSGAEQMKYDKNKLADEIVAAISATAKAA